MTRRTSFDVEIAGVPYLAVKDEDGVPAVRLGSAPEEPGQLGEITTIRFDAFHHGPGGQVDRGEGKYVRSTLDTCVPGAVYPAGDLGISSYPTADLGLTDFLGGVFRDVSGVVADYDALVLAFSPGCYWRMGEASGNLADSSGNANTAVKHGSPTYGVTGAIFGDADKAISLAGNVADYFEVANSASVDTGDVFSIVAWIKKAANNSNMFIVSRPTDGYSFWTTNANKLCLSKVGTGAVVSSTITITDTDWHMVAVTKDGATVHLYIDGADVTETVINETIVANGGVIQIGRNAQTGTLPWNGSLDEIAVYPTALTAANIMTLYNAGMGSTVPGLDTYVFFILPKGVLRYVPTTGLLTLVKAPPANFYFTGSCAKFNGVWWLGVENTDRVSGHMVTFTPATGAWADTTVHGSHVFAARNKMWWAENKGINTPPELNWSDVADLSTAAGPFPIDTGGFTTWLHTLGPYVLVMKQDGIVYGVDEDGVWVPVIKGNSIFRSDPLFGHGSLEFQGRLLIPGYGQLLCVDSSSLQTTDLHPNRVQPGGLIPTSVYTPLPILARLDDTIVACVSGITWRLDEYPEGLCWNVLNEYAAAVQTQAMVQDPLSAVDNRLLYGVLFPALDDTAVFSVCLPSADHIFAPTELTADGYVTSQKSAGEGLASGVSKRSARVRGWASAAGWKIYVGTDTAAVVLCGTTTAEGPYAFDVPAGVAIGRYVHIKPMSPTTPSWSYLSLPVLVDCYAVPSATDDMTITILASQEQLTNLGGEWRRRNSKDIYDALSALVGTSTTLLWGGSWHGTTWTVLVLAVEMTELEGPARDEGQKAVKIYLRRL